MKQQDLVWIRFPYSNLEESKVRPAIILSNDDYNKQGQDVVVCAVTSNLKETPYSLPLDNADLVQGSLSIKSRIRADKLFQVNKSLVLKSFGAVNEKTYHLVVSKIRRLIEKK